jgi:hypothetical protein
LDETSHMGLWHYLGQVRQSAISSHINEVSRHLIDVAQ